MVFHLCLVPLVRPPTPGLFTLLILTWSNSGRCEYMCEPCKQLPWWLDNVVFLILEWWRIVGVFLALIFLHDYYIILFNKALFCTCCLVQLVMPCCVPFSPGMPFELSNYLDHTNWALGESAVNWLMVSCLISYHFKSEVLGGFRFFLLVHHGTYLSVQITDLLALSSLICPADVFICDCFVSLKS